MSTTVDQRVVEMRFDNAQFERNVATSMSTLDKLKQRLNLTGAAKGLDSINRAARNNNLSVLGDSANTVGLRFNAMYTMADQALRRITDRVMQTGERMLKALTIDPITTGFQEYETQINAVQTILANTSSKGTTIDDVNKALEELNTYADKTIYNFTEMTRNIGTFTAAGVDLDTSVSAIQGIANLAAVSGSTSQQASTAMYQLSQALASGTVKLMDWNSVVNAGMGGEVFQNALVRTAAMMAGASEDVEAWRKENIDAYGSFRDSLTSSGWLTTDVLTETLKQFTMAAEEGSKEWEAYKKSLMDTGYTEKQAEEILKMANTATDAATKVKTFTQLWDVLKESAQSGWSQTWKILIGDFEEAKGILTPFADFLIKIIDGVSDARNKLLEAAMDSPFAAIIKKVEDVSKATEKVVDTTAKYGEVVKKVMGGEYGTGEDRWRKLTEEGYNWAKVQNLVNKELGSTVRHDEKLWEVSSDNNKVRSVTIAQMAKMQEGQLRSMGLNTDEIQQLKDLQKTAEAAGYTLEQVIENPNLISGRSLLIDGFKNIGTILVEFAKSAKYAWEQIFPPRSLEERAESIYNVIAKFRKITDGLKFTLFEEDGKTLTDTGDKLVRTFKGLFAAIDIVLTVLGGPLRWAFEAVKSIMGMFGFDILSVTANVGDAIVKFRDWIDANNIFVKALEAIWPYLKKMIDGVSEWIKGFKEVDNIPKHIISGLVNGIKNGIPLAINAIINLGKSIIQWFKDLLGIHSPSLIFMGFGAFIIAGLIAGLNGGLGDVIAKVKELGGGIIDNFISSVKEGFPKAIEWLKTLGGWIKNVFSSIDVAGIKEIFAKIIDGIKKLFGKFDFGTLVAGGITGGFIFAVKKIFDTIGMFANPLDSLGDLFEGLQKTLEKVGNSVAGFFKAAKFEKKTAGLYNLAKALLALAISMVLLASLDAGELAKAGIALAALSGLLIVLSKLTKGSGTKLFDFSFDKMAAGLVGVAVALVIMAGAMKLMGNTDPEEMKRGILAMLAIMGGMIAMIGVFGLCVKGDSAKYINKAGKMLRSVSITMLIMVGTIKLISLLEDDEIQKGGKVMLHFGVFIAALMILSKFSAGDANKVGKMVLKISVAMLILLGVTKLISMMDDKDLNKGLSYISRFAMIIAALVLISSLAGNGVKIGGTLLSMSIAIAILAGIAVLLGNVDATKLTHGVVAIAALTLIVAGMILATRLAGNEAPKIAFTLLAMSVAIGILAGISVLLGFIKTENLVKGILAVGLLGGLITLMIWSTKGAEKCVGNIVAMTVVIAVMTVAIAALSLIKPEKLIPATLALALVMGVFTLMIKAAGSAKKSIGGLIVMTVAMGLIGALLYLLAGLPTENTVAAAAALSITLLALSASMLLIDKFGTFNAKTIASLAVMILVMGVLGGVLYLLSTMQIENCVGSALALGVLLLALVGAVALLSAIQGSAIGGAAAILLIAAALLILTPALIALSGLSWSQLLVGLAALAGVFLILGIAGFALQSVAGTIVLLAASILMIGAAVLATGAGILLAGQGFGVLATTLPAFATAAAVSAPLIVAALTTIITGILDLIPVIATKIGEGIVAFCNAITEGAPAIGEAVKTVILTMIDVIVECVPAFVEGVLTLITEFLNTLAEHLPEIIQAGTDLVVNLINGITEALPDLIQAGFDLIIGFIEGLAVAIEENMPALIEAFDKLFLACIDAALLVLENAPELLKKAGEKIMNSGLIQGIKDKIGSLVEKVKEGIQKAWQAIKNKFKEWKDAGKELIEKVKSGIGEKFTTLKTKVTELITNAKTAITTKFTEWKNAAKDLIDRVKTGFQDKKTAISDKVKEVIDNAKSAIKDKIEDWKDAGKDLLNGFISGIKAKADDLVEKAKGVVEDALDAAKNLLGINSPSKEFAKLGRWSDEGFIEGLLGSAGKVSNAAERVGEGALNSLSSAIAGVAYAVQGGMDADPVIRPVLDLSGVQTGMSAINNMLADDPYFNATANVRAIGSMMNQNGQNGFGEVVSALDKLGKQLGDVRGNVYNVNGITYDDGSNISSAIETIVRAAKVERRI